VKEYGLDKNISYYKNPVPLGSPENWNKSIELAKGEYIKILHHDDWFTDQNSLKQFVELLDENPDAVLGFSGAHVQFENGLNWFHSISNNQILKLTKTPLSLFGNNFIGAPSATIYRKAINQNFDKNLKWVVDFEFYIRLLSLKNKFAFTTKPLVVTFCVEGRVSDNCANDKNIELFEYFYLYKKIKTNTHYNGIQLTSCLLFLAELCIKYDIQHIEEIKETGFEDKIPFPIGFVNVLNRLSNSKMQFIMRLLHRINAKRLVA
jgi:glycosyltransferase involved in cell wall biosynthesis